MNVELYDRIVKQVKKAIVFKKSHIDLEELVAEAFLKIHNNPAITDRKIYSVVISEIRTEQGRQKNKIHLSNNKEAHIVFGDEKQKRTYSDKICSDCKNPLPISKFRRRMLKNGIVKFDYVCEDCRRKRNSILYKEKKSYYDIKSIKWAKENSERVKNLKKKYYNKHKIISKEKNIPVAKMYNSGNIISVHPSLKSAANSIGVSRAEALSKAIKNDKPYKGYIFKTQIHNHDRLE